MKFTRSLQILIFLLLPLVEVAAEPPVPKIAAVDMAKVFSEYYKTKKAEAELKDRAQGFDKELRERAAELKKMDDELAKLKEDAENPAFTEDKRMEKRKLAEAKFSEYRVMGTQLQDSAQMRRKDLDEQRAKMRSTLVDEITKAIQDKARKDGYTLVVDKSGLTFSGVSPFIYVQDSLEITSEIIKIINANQSASGVNEKAKDKEKK